MNEKHPSGKDYAEVNTTNGKERLSSVSLSEVASSKSQLRLLVAEDNQTNQKMITKLLTGLGITPTICENGRIAVETLRTEPHDFVLMDVHMPILDGIDATKEIRALESSQMLHGKRLHIVALTTDTTPQTRKACEVAGMDGFASKPIRKKDLAALLAPWLDDGQIESPANRSGGSEPLTSGDTSSP
ncbi:Hpt sensor hybrid histidine kinase [Diplonema papillatum]|nr:Hpt sensor hybrid histidine kinase [Diplonema papillatum]